MKNSENRRPLANNPFSLCKVDILIPFHGQYEHVIKLVESILRHTWTNLYNIYLIDDCSLNETFITKMQGIPNVKILSMPQHSGFAACINYGIQNSQENYVCIMHSDVEVKTPSWLSNMGGSLLKLKSQGIKLIVPKSNNPLNSHVGLKSDNTENTDDIIATESLPLYCALFHRELFKRVGRLPEYPYAWYEDEYLFWKMQKYGFKQAICGKSWIYHEGQTTINALWKKNPKIKLIMEANRDKCISDINNI